MIAPAGRIVGSLVAFVGAMAVCLGLVTANARLSPHLPWFPLPVLALVVSLATWSERRIGIGLHRPVPLDRRTVAMTACLTVAGLSACVFQGALAGLVQVAETGPSGTSPAFALAYAVVLSVTPAALAEICFRGLMQTGLARLWGPWPAILAVAVINTAAHRWGPELAGQWAAWLLALGAAGWLRSVTGSLWPPLAGHVAANLIAALTLWQSGPFDQGQLGPGAIAVTGTLVVAGLWGAGRLASAGAGHGVTAR